nr:Fur family transcriptional regulator [Desulfurispira natronophila]
MKKNGYKVTQKRRALLEVLEHNARFMSAKEIYESLLSRHPGISYDTVYRNMSIFTHLGLLETTSLDGERRYRLHECSGDNCQHHTHYVICLECSTTMALTDECPVSGMKFPENFQITGHKLEVYGYCQACQENI